MAYLAPDTIGGAPYLAPDEPPTSLPGAGGGTSYATYILETFESRGDIPWANLTGMRWYVFAEVWPTPLGAPIAQGSVESTDGSGACLFDITGQISLLPGARATLAYSNTTGDPEQADLMSFFGTVVVH